MVIFYELVQRAKQLTQLVKVKGRLVSLNELRENQHKRTVSVLVVDRKTKRIVKTTKTEGKSLINLGVKVLAIISGSAYLSEDI